MGRFACWPGGERSRQIIECVRAAPPQSSIANPIVGSSTGRRRPNGADRMVKEVDGTRKCISLPRKLIGRSIEVFQELPDSVRLW